MNSDSRNPLVKYITNALEEFGKVTWPTKEQAALLTGIVVAVSLVMGLLIGAFDLGVSQGYKLLLDKLPELTSTSSEGPASPEPTPEAAPNEDAQPSQ